MNFVGIVMEAELELVLEPVVELELSVVSSLVSSRTSQAPKRRLSNNTLNKQKIHCNFFIHTP